MRPQSQAWNSADQASSPVGSQACVPLLLVFYHGISCKMIYQLFYVRTWWKIVASVHAPAGITENQLCPESKFLGLRIWFQGRLESRPEEQGYASYKHTLHSSFLS